MFASVEVAEAVGDDVPGPPRRLAAGGFDDRAHIVVGSEAGDAAVGVEEVGAAVADPGNAQAPVGAGGGAGAGDLPVRFEAFLELGDRALGLGGCGEVGEAAGLVARATTFSESACVGVM
ncbi:hypothetical protein [Kitasatospora cinereorecta]|uniref:Uncharacterized protein n=1 Tax=Kitasatospora cinereorecta TaxID=285560 RepID=A0ABW0VP88_9ACTN